MWNMLWTVNEAALQGCLTIADVLDAIEQGDLEVTEIDDVPMIDGDDLVEYLRARNAGDDDDAD